MPRVDNAPQRREAPAATAPVSCSSSAGSGGPALLPGAVPLPHPCSVLRAGLGGGHGLGLMAAMLLRARRCFGTTLPSTHLRFRRPSGVVVIVIVIVIQKRGLEGGEARRDLPKETALASGRAGS